MASAWAQLSDEDKATWKKSGMDKATYNNKYGKGGETAPPPPKKPKKVAQQAAAKDLQSKYLSSDFEEKKVSGTEAAEVNRAKAKERAAAHTNNTEAQKSASAATNNTTKSNGMPRISSKMEGYATDRKYRGPDGGMYTAKEADDAGWTPGYYENGQGGQAEVAAYNAKYGKEEAAYAYKDSRAAIQEAMGKAGRAGIYEYQSARDIQDGKGPLAYNNTDSTTATQKERNALIRTFRDSGYDYNHADVLRHMKGGAENKMFTGLYDDYGGYQNWYDNHSIYSGENAQATDHVTNKNSRLAGDNLDADYNLNLGNWTGSKDIIALEEVLRQGNARQQAYKDYINSDEYSQRFGQYDFAANDIFKVNSTYEERQAARKARQDANHGRI